MESTALRGCRLESITPPTFTTNVLIDRAVFRIAHELLPDLQQIPPRMKASFLPVLTALVGLAASSPFVSLTKTTCDTSDAENVPTENNCMQLLQDLWREDLRAVDVSAGSWRTMACSETCKISVMPDEDGTITYGDVYNDARRIVDTCGGQGVTFKGQFTGNSRTTRLHKGGNCRG